MGNRVFISHIHEEEAIALALQDVIEAQFAGAEGCTIVCFRSTDRWRMPGGEDWLRRVKEELTQADVVVLLLSEQSLVRQWVNLEAGAAWIMDRRIIPVYYSGLIVSEIPRPYSDFNAINLENDAPFLLMTLRKHFSNTPLPLRAAHPTLLGLAEAIKRNTMRLSDVAMQQQQQEIHTFLNIAIAEVADATQIPVRHIGMHAWRREERDGEQVMRRIVRARLSHVSSTKGSYEWRLGEGAVGRCLETHFNVQVDLSRPEYAVASEQEWQQLSREVTLGLTLPRFRESTQAFSSLFAVPIKDGEGVVGCISLNIDRDVNQPPASLWPVLSDILQRTATEVRTHLKRTRVLDKR